LRNQVDVQSIESSLQSHARGGHRSLAAGMPGADDDDLELFRKLHLTFILASHSSHGPTVVRFRTEVPDLDRLPTRGADRIVVDRTGRSAGAGGSTSWAYSSSISRSALLLGVVKQ
jgi:hypothetical protein